MILLLPIFNFFALVYKKINRFLEKHHVTTFFFLFQFGLFLIEGTRKKVNTANRIDFNN